MGAEEKYFVCCAPVTKVGVDVLRWMIPLEAETEEEAREEIKGLKHRLKPSGSFALVRQIVICECHDE